MSKYLVDIETNKVTIVDDADDAKFLSLLTQRTSDGRQKYEQTGPQDPRVTEITVPGEHHAQSAFESAGLEPVSGDSPAPHTALGDEPQTVTQIKGGSSPSKPSTQSS